MTVDLKEPINNVLPKLQIKRWVHDVDANSFALELAFNSLSGKEHSLLIPRSAAAKFSEVVGMLLNAGAILPPDPKKAADIVREALQVPASAHLKVTKRCGWHDGSYVTPGQTIGPMALELHFRSDAPADPTYGMMSGTLEAWKEGLRSACLASTYLTFSLGVGFAAPVLDLVGEDEGATFNLHGASSSGKSLASRACRSETGRARKSDMATYDISDRGVEELCYAYNDAAVVFDEEGRTKGGKQQRRERVRSIAYTVPSGQGKVRSTKVRGDLPNLKWRTLALSSSEKPLEEEANRRAAGEQLRHIDVRIPDPKRGGIFDRLEGTPTEKVQQAIRLAGEVEATIDQNFGVAQAPYIAALVTHRAELIPQVRQIVEDLIERVGADHDSWERRFATKFAIVAAGAVIAADYGIAPFTSEHALRCVRKAYLVARKSVFTVEEAVDKFKASFRIAVADETLFPRIDKGHCLPSGLKGTALGFRRKDAKQGDIIAIAPTSFAKMIGSKPLANAVHSVLLEKGVALRGPDGKSYPQFAVQGFDREGRARWICLRASVM